MRPVDRGTETRHSTTYIRQHLLDYCRKSKSSPSQRNPQSSSIKEINQIVHRLVLHNQERQRGLIFHIMLQSPHVWLLKKRWMHNKSYRIPLYYVILCLLFLRFILLSSGSTKKSLHTWVFLLGFLKTMAQTLTSVSISSSFCWWTVHVMEVRPSAFL